MDIIDGLISEISSAGNKAEFSVDFVSVKSKLVEAVQRIEQVDFTCSMVTLDELGEVKSLSGCEHDENRLVLPRRTKETHIST